MHPAQRTLSLLDLTSLNDGDTDESIAALARSAATPFGHPAALCVYARFVTAARAALTVPAKIATVANFPAGDADAARAAAECTTGAAVADEVDVVFPWRALQAGDEAACRALLQACRKATAGKVLKVILESGELDAATLRRACEISIEAGVDFLKTSTGKRPNGASLDAARIMLEAIRASGRPVGFKASGGVRTVADAAGYLALADEIMGPAWATPATMRFGASGLLNDILAQLGGQAPAAPSSGY